MAIPGFQLFLYPVLDLLGDGQAHSVASIRSAMAEQFGITTEELAERLPSGKGRTFNNRVAWSLVHLKGGGFIGSPERTMYAITDTGRELLSAHNDTDGIRLRHLKQYEKYREFRRPNKAEANSEAVESAPDDDATPEERIESAMSDIRTGVAAEVLERVLQQTPEFFEQVVLDVLQAMGYGRTSPGAAKRLGRSGDGGVDGVIREDRLGLDLIYVQAKRWNQTVVGRPEIQQFVGALNGQLASKGVFITTSAFSREAITYAETVSPRVVLIDGKELSEYMVECEVGASHGAVYRVPEIDLDYFESDDVASPPS